MASVSDDELILIIDELSRQARGAWSINIWREIRARVEQRDEENQWRAIAYSLVLMLLGVVAGSQALFGNYGFWSTSVLVLITLALCLRAAYILMPAEWRVRHPWFELHQLEKSGFIQRHRVPPPLGQQYARYFYTLTAKGMARRDDYLAKRIASEPPGTARVAMA